MPAPAYFSTETEQPTGDTRTSTLAFLPLRETTGTVTLRRRGPGTFALSVSRVNGYHRLSQFVSGREIRIKRDGAHWFAGFIDAPSLPNGAASPTIALTGWDCLYALTLAKGTPPADGSILLSDSGATVVLGLQGVLNNATHGPTLPAGAAWFAPAGQTYGTPAFGAYLAEPRNVTALDYALQLADMEGWAIRAGINAAGALTFAAGGQNVAWVDRTGTIILTDGASCEITGFTQDGSRIVTFCRVASRAVKFETKLTATPSPNPGATTLTVTTTYANGAPAIVSGDSIIIGKGTANEETRIVNTVPTSTTFTVTSATGSTHAIGDAVVFEGQSIRSGTASAATSVGQAYHERALVLYNDQVARSQTLRDRLAAAYLAAYDHPLRTATLAVDGRHGGMLDALIAADVRPGDRISLTSYDTDLSTVYSGTAVTIQEMTYTFAAGACTGMALTVGDPLLDDLAALEAIVTASNRAVGTLFG